jgi:hypothetical protein
MRARIVLLMALVSAPLYAETVMVDDQVQVKPASIDVPQRGSTMAQVEARYGAPREKHAAVGKPPITVWDYDGFIVYFEHEYVIHAVVPGSPPVVAAPAASADS